MITPENLDSYLGIGKSWPPDDEVGVGKRLTIYEENKNLWKCKHNLVYTFLQKLYSDNEKEYNKILFLINFHKQLSTFWADLLLSEQPQLKAGEDIRDNRGMITETPEQEYLELLIDRVSLISKAYALRIDMSRYGAGVAKVYAEEGQPAKLQVVSPSNWYPIIGPDNTAIAHLVAWQSPGADVLNIEIHSDGFIQAGKLGLKDGRITSEPYDITEVQTGFNGPMVFPILNAVTSDDLTGTDDYQDCDGPIKRLEATFTRSGQTLDAHSDPAFAVPEDALGPKNPSTGERTYNSRRRIFPLEKDSQVPQYITWDGQLTASFSLIEKTLDILFIVSETCKAAFLPDTLGNALSGTALKRAFMRPLKKSERAKIQFTPALKSILKAISYLDVANGVPGAVLLDDIRITWFDGLPNDPMEEATIAATKKQAGWSTKAILREAGYTEDEADQIATEANEESL